MLPGLNAGDSYRAAHAALACPQMAGVGDQLAARGSREHAQAEVQAHVVPDDRQGVAFTSTTNEAQQRPSASRITVTPDGSGGSGRDHRALRSPTLATWGLSACPASPLRVSRIHCR